MKAGIVCDLYKFEKFKEELTKGGFKFEVAPGKIVTCNLIKVEYKTEAEKAKIHAICVTVENHFKRRN